MSDLCDDQVIHDNLYANTYSLWGNSKYYDIKNLSPQNFANRNGTIGSEISQELKASRWATAAPVEVVPAPEPPDSLRRRTIGRDSLYEDPESINKEIPPTEATIPQDPSPQPSLLSEDSSSSKSPGPLDWTHYYWHKATEDIEQDQSPSRGRKRLVLGPNNVQKKLDKMLAKPVKMAKAENMMQKMGWQGGALGRSGDGIVEPIAPNAVYVGNNAKTKIGFGQSHVESHVQNHGQHSTQIRSPKNSKKTPECRQFYEMNVLQNIYEFVTNNKEIELLFDKNLKRDERKRIHHLVQIKLCSDDLAEVHFDNLAQRDLVLQICDKNCYMLHTQSFGSHPTRQLSLFKVAPPHVYLIVPAKLRDQKNSLFSDEFRERFLTEKNGEEVLQVEIQKPPSPEEADEPEETNPFLISITRNLKKNSECQEEEVVEEVKEESLPEMSDVMRKIVDCFTEFAESKQFSQFKFLGPFSEEEIVAVNEFVEEAVKYVSKELSLFESVFKKVAFEINEDCTGNTVIYKRPV